MHKYLASKARAVAPPRAPTAPTPAGSRRGRPPSSGAASAPLNGVVPPTRALGEPARSHGRMRQDQVVLELASRAARLAAVRQRIGRSAKSWLLCRRRYPFRLLKQVDRARDGAEQETARELRSNERWRRILWGEPVSCDRRDGPGGRAADLDAVSPRRNFGCTGPDRTGVRRARGHQRAVLVAVCGLSRRRRDESRFAVDWRERWGRGHRARMLTDLELLAVLRTDRVAGGEFVNQRPEFTAR